MNIERTVAKVLWSFSKADGGAVSIMRDLANNDLLTAPERARAVRLATEEREHADLSKKWAIALGLSKAPGLDPYSAIALRDTLVVRRIGDLPVRTAFTLAGLYWNEMQSVRAFPRWISIFGKLGRPDLVSEFTQLLGEETDHVAFGRGVSTRLSGCVPGFSASYANYLNMTKHAGVGILSATFGTTIARLEEALSQ
jgi:hypothetical protein